MSWAILLIELCHWPVSATTCLGKFSAMKYSNGSLPVLLYVLHLLCPAS